MRTDYIIDDAINTVKGKFGDGRATEPDKQPTAGRHLYHNVRHTERTLRRAREMADVGGLSEVDSAAVAIAAAAHAVHRDAPTEYGNLVFSSNWASAHLQSIDMPQSIKRLVTDAIKSCAPVFDEEEGGITATAATNRGFSSKSAEQVARITADADIATFFEADGPLQSHLLFLEQQGMTAQSDFDPAAILQAGRAALQTVSAYQFASEPGYVLYEALRPDLAEYHEELLTNVEAGVYDSYEEILEDDIVFARAHRR